MIPMKKLLKPILTILLAGTCLFSLNTYAVTQPETLTFIYNYQIQAQDLKLAKHRTWQRLLYINDKEKLSKVTYHNFFLHPQGKSNPELELNASIAALFHVATDQVDQSFRCRFPARSQWLIEQLNIPSQHLPQLDCPEFQAWFDKIKPYKTTMIFATDFMGNPSSMFGHTLLRIDPKDQKELNLISYALNYAATPESKDNDFAYAWKGLTGQYPSEYSLMPYYHKVKEYGDLESRDLWEYELNLSSEQTQFLIRHIWELQHVKFPYYFINDNCSYALLGLFDIVRPDLNLQQQFGATAIPIETIKALQEADLVKDVIYRPALETQLLAQAKQHGESLAHIAHHVAYLEPALISEQLNSYSQLDQAKILEMAYDDLYLALLSRRITADFAQPRLRALLGQRSQLDISKQRIAPVQPKLDPVQGHHSRNIVIATGKVQNQNVVEIASRQAYHELTDPQAGHRFGTQLVFLQGKLQLREDHFKLEDFKLMSVHSLNPINPFKNPLSWGMQFGWQQEAVHNGKFSPEHQHGVLNFNAQAGYSLANQQQNYLCYAQLQGIAQFGQSLKDGWRVAPAPTFGCLNQWTDRINTVLQVEIPYWLEQNQWNLRLNTHGQYAFNQQNALNINWQYQQQESQDWHKISLGFVKFF